MSERQLLTGYYVDIVIGYYQKRGDDRTEFHKTGGHYCGGLTQEQAKDVFETARSHVDMAAAQAEQTKAVPEWWCPVCKVIVPPDCVTYQERHDVRAGGCGERVGTKPAATAPAPV